MLADKLVVSARKSLTDGRDLVLERLNDQVRDYAGMLQATSGRLKSVSHELRDDPLVAPIAPLVDQAQSAVERSATYLHEHRVDEIAVDLERFSRTRPITATLIATLVGFSVSRAVKASSIRRFDASDPA